MFLTVNVGRALQYTDTQDTSEQEKKVSLNPFESLLSGEHFNYIERNINVIWYLNLRIE